MWAAIQAMSFYSVCDKIFQTHLYKLIDYEPEINYSNFSLNTVGFVEKQLLLVQSHSQIKHLNWPISNWKLFACHLKVLIRKTNCTVKTVYHCLQFSAKISVQRLFPRQRLGKKFWGRTGDFKYMICTLDLKQQMLQLKLLLSCVIICTLLPDILFNKNFSCSFIPFHF